MSRQILFGIVGFILAPLCCAIVAWSGGYNFDARNADVAGVVAFALILGVMGAALSVAASQGAFK